MEKKGLVAGFFGILVTALLAWLVKKDYNRHLSKFSEEEKPEPKKDNPVDEKTENGDETAQEEEKEEPSIISKVVSCFYDNRIVEDDVLYNYCKFIHRPLSSNQMELHILEGTHGQEKFLEVLVRVPENRHYSIFHRSISSALDSFKDQERINGDFQLPVFTKVGGREDKYVLLDYVYVSDEEWRHYSKKEKPWEQYKDGIPNMVKYIRENKSTAFDAGECSLENYCGFQYLLLDGGTDEEIKTFCEFMEEFFADDFIENIVGNNRFSKADELRINILAFHPNDRKLDEVCVIEKGTVIGTVHTVLNENDVTNEILEEADALDSEENEDNENTEPSDESNE